MSIRAVPLAVVLAALAAASLAACGSASTPAPGSLPASVSASPPSLSASAPPATAVDSSPATAASAKACAELDAWQKKHGNAAAPPQQVFDDLINAPQPLSGDFAAWDLAAGTSQPGAEADLLKVWTDCAKAEAAALTG